MPPLLFQSGDCGLLQEAALALSPVDYRAPPNWGGRNAWVISIRLGPQVLSEGFIAAAENPQPAA